MLGSDIVMHAAEGEIESLTRQRVEVDEACHPRLRYIHVADHCSHLIHD